MAPEYPDIRAAAFIRGFRQLVRTFNNVAVSFHERIIEMKFSLVARSEPPGEATSSRNLFIGDGVNGSFMVSRSFG